MPEHDREQEVAGPEEQPGDLPTLLTSLDAHAPDGTPNTGALWKLAEPGRQLDANLVRLAPGQHVDTHVEPDLDVLLLVTGGAGTLGTENGDRQLTEGTLLWLPHGSSRSLAAGQAGLTYLTVHRRRPGMRIRPNTDGWRPLEA